MSNSVLEGIIKEKDYVFKKLLFKIIKDFSLTINELLLLIYFINQEIPILNIDDIAKETYLSAQDILAAFTNLNTKGLISIKVVKDNDKVNEIIDLSNIYKAMVSDINVKVKEKNTIDIFNTFENEFGRTLSPMEFEIINAWLKSGIKEEIILGALKEATFNGVSSLRYIDKIIFEWGKKGFKTMDDVNTHLTQKESIKHDEKRVLFDYNWLDDDEDE